MTYRTNDNTGNRLEMNRGVPSCVRQAEQQNCTELFQLSLVNRGSFLTLQVHSNELKEFTVDTNFVSAFVLHSLFSLFLSLPVSLSDRSKSMLTELCLASDEFDHFAVTTQNSVTFCLKELRVRRKTKKGIKGQNNWRISQEGVDWENVQRGREVLWGILH